MDAARFEVVEGWREVLVVGGLFAVSKASEQVLLLIALLYVV